MKIEIFEPSLCCPTGVCRPEPDPDAAPDVDQQDVE